MESNLNKSITIYPNETGWRKIVALTANNYLLSEKEAKEIVNKHKTKDGGYKDQHWSIINDLHSMFFNGQNFLKTADIKIDN